MLALPSASAFDSFELDFDVTRAERPTFEITLRGVPPGVRPVKIRDDGVTLQSMFSGKGRPTTRLVDLSKEVFATATRINVRLFVNRRVGTTDIYFNGSPVAHLGRSPEERSPGIGDEIEIQPGQAPETIFSNLWLGPWSGELPMARDAAQVCLLNGDVIRGTVVGSRDGNLRTKTEAGDLDLPLEKIKSADFGGDLEPKPTAGRLCFLDGSTVNVESFHWDKSGLAAHSSVLGDFRLPANAVRELILNPSLPRAPHPLESERPAEKSPEAERAPAGQK